MAIYLKFAYKRSKLGPFASCIKIWIHSVGVNGPRWPQSKNSSNFPTCLKMFAYMVFCNRYTFIATLEIWCVWTYVSEHVRQYVFDKSSLEILHFGIKPRFTALKIILFTFNTSDGVGFLDTFRHTRPLLLLFTTIILYSSLSIAKEGGILFTYIIHLHQLFLR